MLPSASRLLSWLVLGVLGLCATSAWAQRQTVSFQINQSTVVGQSVFVLGDLPELGGNDVRRAVKLDPSAYPVWRVNVSLPAGRSYTYRYYLRDDGPGRTGDATNGTPLGAGPVAASTSPVSATHSKTILLNWDVPNPTVHWRLAGASGAFTGAPMTRFGNLLPAASNEKTWLAWNLGATVNAAPRDIEFYFTDALGGSRYPASGQYTLSMPAAFVRFGQQLSYVPSASVTGPRRDYSIASPPGINSTNLGQFRQYRVFLPRGYDQHPTRRYPVVYMHDGQNVFESGPFGSWNAALTFETLTNAGTIREVIVVGVDNIGSTRIADYLPPDDAGRANLYAAFLKNELKPIIDAQYRTLPGGETTGAIGSSMGGVVSLYLGHDHAAAFTRIGAMSGAWQTCNLFLNRVRSNPARSIRIALDSGDSGAANDNYWLTYNLRDHFTGGTNPKYPLESTLDHAIGFGQQHNEAAWAQRLPTVLSFLYPASEEPNEIVRMVFGPQLDANGDGAVDLEDLYTQNQSPADLDLNGTANDADTEFLQRVLRTLETEALSVRS